MKIFTYLFFVLALILIGVNVFMVDFKKPLEGQSLIAIIGILAVLCAVVIILIFNISKSIDKKIKKNS
jgi:hypothetical protein